MRKIVGNISPEECKEIQALYERKNGLSELVKILDVNNSEMYEKVIADFGETSVRFQNWWDRMINKYHWEEIEGGHWEVDFSTCDIILVK